MSRNLFIDHPVDIQHYILEEFDSPKDLLNLALASKSFYSLVVPHHIQFRILRCTIQKTDVWETLSTQKHVCARFRRLEVIPCVQAYSEDRQIYPSCLLKEPTQGASVDFASIIPPEESETQCKAIVDTISVVCEYMTALHSFQWLDEHGPNGFRVGLRSPLDAILAAIIGNCSQLQSMQVSSSMSTFIASSICPIVFQNFFRTTKRFYSSIMSSLTTSHNSLSNGIVALLLCLPLIRATFF